MSTKALVAELVTSETVTQVHHWTDKLFSFKTTRPPDYQFIPGQYARLGLHIDSGAVWRAYSIVSAPNQDYLEYYGVVVPGGIFTSALKDIQPGATILTEKTIYGFMTPNRFSDGDELWMLATGTGLGPFISILRDPAVWLKFRHLILVHCVRHAEEFSYQDELFALQENSKRNPSGMARFQFIQSATREKINGHDAPSDHLHARITTLLDNGALETKAGLPITVESSRIMLCGNPAMIEDTRRILHQRGLRPCRRMLPGQFVTENYW